jgi:hypothetical protein
LPIFVLKAGWKTGEERGEVSCGALKLEGGEVQNIIT